jgi:hypothetical protein
MQADTGDDELQKVKIALSRALQRIEKNQQSVVEVMDTACALTNLLDSLLSPALFQ